MYSSKSFLLYLSSTGFDGSENTFKANFKTNTDTYPSGRPDLSENPDLSGFMDFLFYAINNYF